MLGLIWMNGEIAWDLVGNSCDWIEKMSKIDWDNVGSDDGISLFHHLC